MCSHIVLAKTSWAPGRLGATPLPVGQPRVSGEEDARARTHTRAHTNTHTHTHTHSHTAAAPWKSHTPLHRRACAAECFPCARAACLMVRGRALPRRAAVALHVCTPPAPVAHSGRSHTGAAPAPVAHSGPSSTGAAPADLSR